MIWAILIFLGVPVWLCVLGIATIVFRSRGLRRRYGNVPVRVLRPGHQRWTRGHAIWVSDVFAWRGSPAAWAEDLRQVTDLLARPASAAELAKHHRLGADLAVVDLTGPDGETVTVVAAGAHRATLLGPFAPSNSPTPEPTHEAG